MSRRLVLTPETTRRIRRDPRFRTAQGSRIPDPDWRARGLCLREDPDTFFPTSADNPTEAIAICQRCDVAGPCLAAALESNEIDGVWGATTPEERRGMRLVWLSGNRCARPVGSLG